MLVSDIDTEQCTSDCWQLNWKTSTCASGSVCPYTVSVWAKSTQFACVVSQCAGQTNNFYCDYYPYGGYSGQQPYSVAKGVSTPTQQTPVPPTQQPRASNTPSRGQGGSIDWSSMMTPVRDQGNCGSCFAFTALANLEAMAVIQKGYDKNSLDLSEQYCVNCISNGCVGGWFATVWQQLQSSGVPMGSSMPYQAYVQQCSKPQGTYFKWSGYNLLPDTNVQTIINALQKGPISIGMWTDGNLKAYRGGVYSCPQVNRVQNHAILLVGYNADGNYWIIKNSWGPGWGENGYFRLTNSNDNCFIRGFVGGYPVL
ncbi:hypothetical protein SAMD00019534_072980 [Acytostelium subglobosum LB1]|uniref:hypothetical protein n=1 Tax=Acytostelium subglobosum LB1 TaxID=1410327 RepID=UPI000644B9E3|nr:hypothetical protein SAMD00019534_072980 [Acytostelium subglobosum LB1]GAM24123.1 hypothetical protein SAMD00019534_072980 [Acytostelium subglobosum LB1]|eukprot:XP_012753159.1 hypothetical protein SAMD00019534_072980 [Acytostelium subglobosum LB1]